MQETEDIYSIEYTKKLFDEMSRTYDRVNYYSSFGFSQRWRRQFLQTLDLKEGMTVYDLMTGMGEVWLHILKKLKNGKLIAVDLSTGMVEQAREKSADFSDKKIEILQTDVLGHNFPDETADSVTSAFGVKTFSPEQLKVMANQIYKLLKPGGQFSLVEISVPQSKYIRFFYMFYLKKILPYIGRLLLGNPDNYRMLGTYTENFGSCRPLIDIFTNAGLEVYYRSYFMGCATGIYGFKPIEK